MEQAHLPSTGASTGLPVVAVAMAFHHPRSISYPHPNVFGQLVNLYQFP